tara:strand:- start:462 stop:1940 length:1479 start_codon:yes stop_codon:yes gene_type:complete
MLTKSNFVVGHECQRCFWFAFNGYKDPNLDEGRLKDGEYVGEEVKKIFPDGVEIPFLGGDYTEMHRLTMEAINTGAEVIFEGSFLVGDVFIRVDVMQKTKSGWDIYEVKSSSDIKTIHKEDASIQWYVLNQIEQINLREMYVITLNKEYYKEKELDLEEVFRKHPPLTEYVNSNLEETSKTLKNLRKVSKLDEPPLERIPGSSCSKQNCSLKHYCWPEGHDKKNSVFKLFNMHSKKKFGLYDEGIDTFEKIKELEGFSKIQQMQIEATLKNKPIIDKEIINDFISKVEYPISYFDFETYSEPIPSHIGQKPNDKVPFQYSLHIQDSLNSSVDSDGAHYKFLADHTKDPRREIAESMLKDIPETGSIITYYQHFEKGRIKDLAKFCPDLSDELLSLNDRILDLMHPFSKGGYYHPDFEGKVSIKKVLPALCKDDKKLDYKNLNIKDGGEASSTFRALKEKTAEEAAEIRKDLLEYCFLDTYAMYAIYKKLQAL